MDSKRTPATNTRYRKKPVVIDALQWFKIGDHPNVVRPWEGGSDYRCQKCGRAWGEHGLVQTLETEPGGGHHVCPGDWIITGIKGEHYACKPDIFAVTYEAASDGDLTENHAEIGKEFCERILKIEPGYSWSESPLEFLTHIVDQRDEALASVSETGDTDQWVWWDKGDGIAVGPRSEGAKAIVFTVEEAQAICRAVNRGGRK